MKNNENIYVQRAEAETKYFKQINPYVSVYVNREPDEDGKFRLPKAAVEIILECILRDQNENKI